MTTTKRRPGAAKRTRNIQRAVHLVAALPLLSYVYATPDASDPRTLFVRFVAIPVLVVTGMLMWQMPLLRRALARRKAE